MSRIGRVLLLVVLLVAVGADREARAFGDDPGVLIETFLSDYQEAFNAGNPFLLQRYDPSWKVFQPLLHSTWFDHVARGRVELMERQTALQDAETATYLVSFVKVQEDIHKSGLFTRGLAGIKMEVRITDGRLQVLSHKTFPPRVAVEGYLSTDPRSWGEEHSRAERYLYRGLEYLRDGDMKSAEDQIERALELVRQGNIPKFAMGPAYFMAMCYYYSAILQVKRSDFATASEQLEEALILHPDFPAALNLRAELHYNEAEHARARELWQRSLELHSDQPAIEEIVGLLQAAAESKRKSTTALLHSLVNLPPAQAVQVLAPAVKKRSRDKVLVPLLAKAYIASGDPEKAMEVLEASRLVGRATEATYLAARIQLKMQRPEEALALFEQTLELDPNYRDALIFAVSLYAAQGQFRAAIARLDASRPEHWGGALHALKGKYNLMAGRFLDAVSELEIAVDARLPAKLRAEVAYMVQRISRQRR